MRAGDVDGLGSAIVVALDGELDGISLGNGAEAVGADRGLVDEEVFTARVPDDEAEALHPAEPLHRPRLPPLLRHPRPQNPNPSPKGEIPDRAAAEVYFREDDFQIPTSDLRPPPFVLPGCGGICHRVSDPF